MNKKSLGAIAAAVAVALAFGAWRWWAAPRTPNGDGIASASSPGPAASGAGGPISVGTVRAQQRDYDVMLEATGTVTALNSVDVKPQVSSVVTKVHFREGQFVRQGELLFTLDSRTDEANLAKAQAQLQKDLAALADAQRQLARSKELLAQNFVSQVAVDTNQTLVDAQQGAVAADRAALDAARVALSLNRLVAPSAGRAGAVNVFPGSSVQPSSPALVTITQLDPIAVSFNLPQRDLDDALQALRSGGGKVAAVLPENRGSLVGRLQFVDNAVDASSGTVKVKATFDNREEKLWPGAFVGVKLAVRTLKDAIVVPQAAILQSVGGRLVYVVDAGNKVSARPVELIHSAGTDAVVSGVKAGERIIVDGRQNVRPGAIVSERANDGARGAAGTRRGVAASAAASGAAMADSARTAAAGS